MSRIWPDVRYARSGDVAIAYQVVGDGPVDLVTDIVGSTERAAELGDRAWRDLLASPRSRAPRACPLPGAGARHAGDGFFATFDGPAGAIRCAQAIVADVGELDLDVRAGLHTGECELHDRKLAGIAVSIGSRSGGRGQARRSARLEHGEGPGGGVGNRVRGAWRACAQGRPR